jgi:ubiquinol-cytochrome c reductase core subunit 2
MDICDYHLMIDYEFHDDVLPLAQLEYDAFQTNPVALALDAVHSAAFHRGLGTSLLASPTIPVHNSQLIEYAKQAYSKANLVLVASGASAEELKPHIEQFWKDLPAGQPLTSAASKFTGGESRISHRSSQNVFAIAFPGSALYGSNASPEQIVLSHLLGGVSPVKWTTGHSAFAQLASGISRNVNLYATNISYSDAGLFTILVTGSAADVSKAASAAVKLLRDISKGGNALKPEDVKRAIASARYATYAATEARLSGLEPIGQSVLDTGKVVDLDSVVSAFDKVTPDKLKQVSFILPSKIHGG